MGLLQVVGWLNLMMVDELNGYEGGRGVTGVVEG